MLLLLEKRQGFLFLHCSQISQFFHNWLLWICWFLSRIINHRLRYSLLIFQFQTTFPCHQNWLLRSMKVSTSSELYPSTFCCLLLPGLSIVYCDCKCYRFEREFFTIGRWLSYAPSPDFVHVPQQPAFRMTSLVASSLTSNAIGDHAVVWNTSRSNCFFESFSNPPKFISRQVLLIC